MGEQKEKRNHKQMKMELTNLVLAALGLLLWNSGCSSAAPMECHFDSRGETSSFNVFDHLKLFLLG